MGEPLPRVGSWRIERTLLDRRIDRSGSFTGRLQLTPTNDGGYGWYESGTLHWDGHHLAAERTLGLRQRDGQWWLTFADGRPFHPWVVDQPITHPCRADIYSGLVESSGEFEFVTNWQVNGPTKDQLIVSTYRYGPRGNTVS